MHKIVIVDDHSIVLDGYSFIFADNDNINIVGTASNGVEALQVIETRIPDIVLLDINMPIMNGLEAAKIIKVRWPKMKIIMLTMFSQVAYIKDSMALKVDGYLLKNSDKKTLLEAVDTVMKGGHYYDKNIKEMMGDGFVVPVGKKKTKAVLSDRELGIISLIAKGKSSKEIATDLFISAHTVQTHRKNIFFKLEIHNAGELVKFAIENNLM